MRTFSIPTASLGLTLTTACGTPLLDLQNQWQERSAGSEGSDTEDPSTTEAGIAGLWLGAHLSWYGGEEELPSVYSYADGSSYSYTINLELNADLQGSLLYEGEGTYEDGTGFSYSDSYACTATPTGNNTYNITTQELDLSMHCIHDGPTLDCEALAEEFSMNLNFTR